MEGRDSKKAQVIKAEMDLELQDEAIHTAAEACDRYDELSEIIEFVKKEFDKKHGSSWHCFAGTSFCSAQTSEEDLLFLDCVMAFAGTDLTKVSEFMLDR
ncbi:dynein light chain type 1 [Opisthorchis viverrini]|uniref:Dynein light chain n=1 Tax=Opisthorchis viverrini TaxID=6198 RepID=A0A1S8WTG1_OPIVI|nr:dynein light chain type 1 [Opisthorchis viverrini]